MNISKQSREMTETSARLSNKLRDLVDENSLETVSWALEQLKCERTDALLIPKLRELLEALPSAERIHVFYDSDDASYFRIYVEGKKDRGKIRSMCRKLESLWRDEYFKLTHDMLDFVSKSNFEMHRKHIGAKPVVIERK